MTLLHLALDKDFQNVEPVSMTDADHLARAVDFPASQSGPLFRSMFPRPEGADFSEQQKEDIVRWHCECIRDAIMRGRTHLRKLRSSDGTVAGLAGWVVEGLGCLERTSSDKSNIITVETAKADNEQTSEPLLPAMLDVSAWLSVSAALRRERQRVIGHLNNVCRITIMSVSPEHQHQGLGSALMEHICQDIDRHSRYGYVLSSPAGVRLYSKFGFEAVGQVDTPYGSIMSMLRRRRGRSTEGDSPLGDP